jgi:hypothetical protein
MPAKDGSPLALDAETMRRLGYRTIDMLVDRITGPGGPVVRTADPAELRERLATPPPETPESFEAILEGLERDVLPFASGGSAIRATWPSSPVKAPGPARLAT